MSAGAKSKTAGRWQDAVVSRKSTDERSTEISAMKAKHVTKLPKGRTPEDVKRASPGAGYFYRKGLPSHVPSSWPGFQKDGQEAAGRERKSKSPGVTSRSPPRPDPFLQRRRSSSESRVSGSSGAARTPKHASDAQFDSSYSFVFPDRSSPAGVPTSGGSVRRTYDDHREKNGREITAALGRTGSDASEVQSPLREPDLAQGGYGGGEPDLEASLRQDLMEKPLSFSDTMGLKWPPDQDKHAADEHATDGQQPWANCRDEGPWSIAARRAASPDSGESFAFPEVLPREVLRFAEAPLKPLPEWDAAGLGSPGAGGGPLEQSWLQNREQEIMAECLPQTRAVDGPALLPAATGHPQTSASPARSPARSPAHSTAGNKGGAANEPGSARGRSPTASGGSQGQTAPIGQPSFKELPRERSRERSLSPEPGKFIGNPAHPLHARSPWSAGLEAYATQLSDSCPRQPTGSCHSAPRSAASRPRTPAAALKAESATGSRSACRSLRQQFEAASPPAATSPTPSNRQVPPSSKQQEAVLATDLGAAETADAEEAATPLRPATKTAADARSASAAGAARALLGSAGKSLSHSLTGAQRGCGGNPDVSGLCHLAGRSSEAAAAQTPKGSPAKYVERVSEGARACLAMAAAAGLGIQVQLRRKLVAWREARAAADKAAAEVSDDRSFPSAAQIADAVTDKVVRKQVAFLLLAFLTLLATTLLPVALTLARHAAAAAASREAAAAKPIVDNNDYTCLGLPWFS